MKNSDSFFLRYILIDLIINIRYKTAEKWGGGVQLGHSLQFKPVTWFTPQIILTYFFSSTFDYFLF